MYPYETQSSGLDTGGFLDGVGVLAGALGNFYHPNQRPNGTATPPPGPAPVLRPAGSLIFSPWAFAAGVAALVVGLVLLVRR